MGWGMDTVTLVTPATWFLYAFLFSPVMDGTSLVHRGPNFPAFDKPHHLQLNSDLAKLQSDK